MSVKLKIATFNLRCNVKVDGINMFDNRKGQILDKIYKEMPDIIGFQEMLPAMKKFLAAHMPDYHIVGRSRTDDYTGEHVDIAYKKSSIELFALEYFWLSPTPYTPGSRYEEQSTCPRITTSGIFKHKDLKTPFRVYNTHLDHVGERARVLGVAQIIDKIQSDNDKINLPYFITGDFNATPDSECISLILKNDKISVVDLTQNVEGSFHGFSDLNKGKIDYIFADSKTANASYETSVWDNCSFGIYLSDHYPLCTEINISEESV